MLKQLKNLQEDFIRKNSFNISKAVVIGCICGILLLISVLFATTYGTMGITKQKVFDIIFYHMGFTDYKYWTKTEDLVIWNLRLPRAVLACMAGAGLAVSGVAMQAAVKNPLADPYILGISAGASAGATAVIAADLLDITAEYSISIGAFGGAIISMLILFMLNKGNRDSVKLLLSGCVISILFSSISSDYVFGKRQRKNKQCIVLADGKYGRCQLDDGSHSFGNSITGDKYFDVIPPAAECHVAR